MIRKEGLRFNGQSGRKFGILWHHGYADCRLVINLLSFL